MEQSIDQFDIRSEEGRMNIQKKYELQFSTKHNKQDHIQKHTSFNWVYSAFLLGMLAIITFLLLNT